MQGLCEPVLEWSYLQDDGLLILPAHGVRMRLLPLLACCLLVAGACKAGGGGGLLADHDGPADLGFRVPDSSEYRVLQDHDALSPTIEFMTRGLLAADFYNKIQAEAASCMQLRGWTYEPVFVLQPPEPRTVGQMKDTIESFGYRTLFLHPPQPDESAPTEAVRRNRTRFEDLSPTDQRRFLTDYDGMVGEGVPTPESCLGQAQIASRSSLYHSAAGSEMSAMNRGVWASVEAQTVNQHYGECMARRGYDVGLPYEAYMIADDLYRAYSERAEITFAEGAAREIRIASDDFECQLETRLSWYHAAEVEMVRLLTERYPELALEP